MASSTSTVTSGTGSLSFGGLISGLNTQDIVAKLTALKKTQLVDPIQKKIDAITAQKEALSPIEKALNDLKVASYGLKEPGSKIWNTRQATSSDTNTIVIAGVDSSKAVPATYKVTEISALAQPDRIIFTGQANKDITQYGSGTITITYKSVTTNIAIDSTTSTLDNIATAINNAGIGVTASIVDDGSASTPYRLTLTAGTTGADTTITHNINTVYAPLTVDPISTNAANEPLDAAFKVNAIAMTSANNTVSEAIPGVSFSLLATDIVNTKTITVKQATSSIVSALSAFVTSYSAAREAIKKAIMPDANNKFGPLGHDNNLTTSNVELARIMGSTMLSLTGYPYDTLADIGITTDTAGIIKVDTSKLTTSLESNVTGVRLLFQGSTSEDGIAERLWSHIDNLLNPQGTIRKRQDYMSQNTLDLQELIKRRQKMVDQYQARLLAQYNSMEMVLNRLKTSQQQLDAFTNMPDYNS